MWSDGSYDRERNTREQVLPWSHPSDGCHGELHSVPKKPPLLGKRPPLLGNRPPLLDRHGERSYSRYFSDVDYQEHEEDRHFSHERRSVPPQREDQSGYPWSRYNYSASCQSDNTNIRDDDFRRKYFYSSRYKRDQYSDTRDPPFCQKSPVGQQNHAVINIMAQTPPVLEKRPPLVDRPGKGSYTKYYSDVNSQEYGEGRSFSHERRSCPPQRGEDSDYQSSRYDHFASRQSDSMYMRDGFTRKSAYSSHYTRDQSPGTKDPPSFRESCVGQTESRQNTSVSSVKSRSCSAVRNKFYTSHQPQHTSKERQVQSLKTPRCTSLSSPTAGPSSKVLYEHSKITEKEHAEAESKSSEEKHQASEEQNLPGISEVQVQPAAPLGTEKPEEPETNAANSTKLLEDSQLSGCPKAIASKVEEIQQTYRQYSEIFGMVVRKFIEKDPSLEKPIQLALRKSLEKIGEECVEELKHFIAAYETSIQHFGKPV